MWNVRSVKGAYVAFLKHKAPFGMTKIFQEDGLYIEERHLDALFRTPDGTGFSLVFRDIYKPSWWEKLRIRWKGRILRFHGIHPERIEIWVK